jgi:hypothetical protein
MAAGKSIREVSAKFVLKVDKSGFKQAEASIEHLKGNLAPTAAGKAAGKSLSSGLARVEQQFGGLFDSIKSGVDGAGGSLGDLAGGLGKGGLGGALTGIGAGVAVVAAITAGLTKLALASAKVADEADKMAQRTGISTDEWQRLAYAGKMAGAGAQDLKAALQQVADTYEDARKGGGEQIKTLRALGLTWRDLKGQSPAQMLETISDRLVKLPPTERIAVAKKIGKSWADLLPLLSAGGKGLKEAGDEAAKFNLVMSEDQIKTSVEFNDNWTRTTSILEGFRNMLAKDLMPLLNETVKAFVDWYKANKQIIDQRVQMTVEGIAGAFKLAYYSLQPFIAAVEASVAPLKFLFEVLESIWVWSKGGDSLIGDMFTTSSEKLKEWAYDVEQAMKSIIPVEAWLQAIDEFILKALDLMGPLAGPLGMAMARGKSPTRALAGPVTGQSTGILDLVKNLGAGAFRLPAVIQGLAGGPAGPQPVASGPNGEPIYAAPMPSIPAPSIPEGPQSLPPGDKNVSVNQSVVINGATDENKVRSIVEEANMSMWREVQASY